MTDQRYLPAMTRAVLAGALAWLAVPVLAAVPAPAVAATSAERPAAHTADTSVDQLTLEQAVTLVQNKTHGKVLRAGSRLYGNMIEYRIKVLTPDGHVRVIPVRSRQDTLTPAHNPKETH